MAVLASSNLSDEINRATRSQHIELNRLLINRLSLALPPHSSTPLLYGKGLVPFARIFLFFEIELGRGLDEEHEDDDEEATARAGRFCVGLLHGDFLGRSLDPTTTRQ
ncbi:unnamed protein product [Zymoseptoria tritici ST99CH_3D7]|uniref:Uncharacterized protein n=1 Tax=Zymoseptoria tritici (strain ST99CH_3D7) TaxID=1276538 RepID=A0A1X7RKC4_ZYMT9|nr:unnamed protein product [Zymoseptoria tritici ST99CH_3D7]